MFKYAEAEGWQIDFQDAKGDEKLQMQQVENLITKGVDALVVLPQNAEAATGMVAQAKEAGIPFICIDRVINAEIDYFVGMNNDVIGDIMAEYVFARMPKGNYALIAGAPTDPNVKIYKDGWMRVIQAAVDSGEIKIVDDASCENWDPNNALRNMENFLTVNNDKIDVVLAMNDGTAGGSIQALKARDLNGKVLVTGQDGELAACQRIVQGDQTMTVWKPDNVLAQQTVVLIKELLEGKTPTTNAVINNGVRDVPSFLVQPVKVDKANMDSTIIAAGYYPREEVYK
jgi:D-xylose transport system substrate-binding protein